MAMFDDTFDEFPLHPSLRIPPLMDPFPFLNAASDRPSPLEPNAGVNTHIDNETAKLTGRRKALAEAKPLGESGLTDLRPLPKSPRKRQKLYDHERIAEFVQLPKPESKSKEGKPLPFEPISVLHELHEPPPSAALFPPITPSVRQDEQHWIKASAKHTKPAEPLSAKKKVGNEGNNNEPTPRRLSLRPRMKWSEAETEYLLKGVAIYGMGKWKKILNHPEFAFQQGRTPVDLKDRFRTCAPQILPDSLAITADRRNSHANSPIDQATIAPQVCDRKRTGSPGPNRKKARKRPWSESEDTALVEGYRLHGFQWTVIAKDPSLKFNNRSGPQVRDRFRLKCADLYSHGALVGVGQPASSDAASYKPPETEGPGYARAKTKAWHEDSEDGEQDNAEYEQDTPEPPHRKSHHVEVRASVPPSTPYGIMGLLNDEEYDSRPSSFRFEGWDENVTLPPLLLWEDMATRPMFELE